MKTLFTNEEIENQIKNLSEQLSTDYKGKKLCMISILKGSFMFFSDLVKNLSIPVRIEFLKASSYQNSTISSGKVEFELTNFDLQTYHVVLIEDIVDTGNTVNEIAKHIQAQGVLSLKVCSLLFKKEKYHKDLPIEYYGFLIDDQFVVGYGMDFAEQYRNLNYIGVYNA